MDNRVGDNAPNEKKLTDLLARLKSVLEELKTFGVLLTADERGQLLHPRIGADPHIATVHALAVKYGVKVPSIPLSGMEADARLAAAMKPLEAIAELVATYTADTRAEADHEKWQAFLAHYGVLANMAQRNPELAAELQSVTDFMSTGRRRKPQEPK